MVLEGSKTLIAASPLAKNYWSYAAKAFAFQHNCITSKYRDHSPYESLYGKSPPLQRINIFGIKGWAHVEREKRKKLDNTSKEAYFLCYSDFKTGFIVLDCATKSIRYTRSFSADEEEYARKYFDSKETGEHVQEEELVELFDKDLDNTQLLDYNTIRSEEVSQLNNLFENVETMEEKVPNDLEVTKESTQLEDTVVVENTELNVSEIENEAENNIRNFCDLSTDNILPVRTRSQVEEVEENNSFILKKIFLTIKRMKLMMKARKSQYKKGFNSYVDALKSDERWEAAYTKELKKLEERGGLKVVKRTSDMDCIPFREVLTRKIDNITGEEVLKVRLAARGDLQKNRPTDTYSPTVATDELRQMIVALKSMGCYVMQGDCPSAYLNALLDESVFLLLPDGHPLKEDKELVYECPSALYGLAIAGKAWYWKFVSVMKEFGLEASLRSPCLFKYKDEEELLVLQLYVDDFIYGSASAELMIRFNNFLEEKLQVKSTFLIKKFVGLEFDMKDDLFLHQESMIKKLEEEYNVNTIQKTPMIENLKWKKSSKELENIRSLQKLIGELSYIGNLSRPDVTFAINKISRVLHKPTKETYEAAKRVLSYLCNTSELAIKVCNWDKEKWELILFCDSSFADNVDDKYKSTAGNICYLNGTPISWKSKKLKWVCTSSSESEYMSCYFGIRNAMKIAFDLEEIYGKKVWPIKVYINNMAVLQVIKKTSGTTLTKHMALKYLKVQEWYSDGYIHLDHVPSKYNIADLFTKPLGEIAFKQLRESILQVRGSVQNIYSVYNGQCKHVFGDDVEEKVRESRKPKTRTFRTTMNGQLVQAEQGITQVVQGS